MKNVKHIIEGWKNHLAPSKDEASFILEFSSKRRDICNSCPLNKNNVCSSSLKGEAVQDFTYLNEQRFKGVEYKGCGCPLSPKTKSPHSCCPLGKWLNI